MKMLEGINDHNSEMFDFMYMVDINEGVLPDSVSKSRMKSLAGMNLLISSSNNASAYAITSRKKWSKRDCQIPIHFGKEYYHWQYEGQCKSNSPYSELLKYNYKHKASFQLDCYDSSTLNGRFYLFFKNSEFVDSPSKLLALKDELSNLHHELYDQNRYFLNPFLAYGLVTEKDILLISHIAVGSSRTEIAAACNLTARGVDYRITRLKEKLAVRNIANLIRVASENNLVMHNLL